MTRDPAHTSYLPTLLKVRQSTRTVDNAIDAYEVLSLRMEWGTPDVAAIQRKQANAVNTIKSRLRDAYDLLDCGPTERERFARELRRSRDENAALRDTVQRLQADNQRLTAANVAAMEGRKVA